MIRKIASVAALWLLLAALVLVYTDRGEYTWTFTGEETARVLLSTQQANARERRAQAAMDREKADSRARAAQGEVKEKDLYNGAPKTRPAVDGEIGLNLMWGEYEATIAYDAPRDVVVSVRSALRDSFIRGGEAALPAGAGERVIPFTLTDSCQQVTLACSLPEGAKVHSVTVRRSGAGVFSRDLAAYAALLGAVLTALTVLSWDARPVGRENRRDALAVVMIALFASMPLLWRGVYDGHDLFFHLNRIEGIASGLRAGQFPVRIHASTLLGYGYAAPQFYPEVFLYIPALLRNLGVSLAASVRVFELMINLATAFACYASARGLLGERRIALGATALYTLCSYRMANLYVRATLGESLAMIFFPLLLWAAVEVFVRDRKRWPLMALAMTGIALSHLLSTLFAAALCAVGALLCAPKLLRQPGRIAAILKAAGLTVLCASVFVVPFLSYAGAGINTSVALMASDHVLTLGGLLVGFPGAAQGLPYEATDFSYTVGVVPGLAILLGCAACLMRLYMREGKRTREDKLCAALLLLGGALLLCATEMFPWAWLCSLPRPYSSLFRQIQYPWRLVGVAAPMLAIAGAWGLMKEEKARTAMLALVCALCMVCSGYSMQSFVQDVPLLEKESFCDTRIEQFEYTYEGTEKQTLAPGEIVALDAPVYQVRDYHKQGTNLTLTLDAPQGLSSLELPLLYYPGYRASAYGEELRVSVGNNNVVRLYAVPSGEGVEIRVWYEAPMCWQAAAGASLLGLLALCALLGGMRRRDA